MDYEGVKKAAQSYIPDMTKFLRDLIAIPSESCEEEGVVKRTIEEMKKLGFDKAEIPSGSIWNTLYWVKTDRAGQWRPASIWNAGCGLCLRRSLNGRVHKSRAASLGRCIHGLLYRLNKLQSPLSGRQGAL